MEVALLLESGLSYWDIGKLTYAETQMIINGRKILEEERERKMDKKTP